MLEEGGGLHEAAGEDAHVVPRRGQVVVGEAGDVERRVLLRRVDVVRGAVVVHEEGLVAGHLAALEIAGHDVQAVRLVGQLSARELVLAAAATCTFCSGRMPRGHARALGRKLPR